MDPRSTRLLWDLRAALLRAMGESTEMQRVLDQLRQHGWSAYLVIDGTEDEEAAEEPSSGSESLALARRPSLSSPWKVEDLTFLRSLGIDPGSGGA